jgi:hypothetical protein
MKMIGPACSRIFEAMIALTDLSPSVPLSVHGEGDGGSQGERWLTYNASISGPGGYFQTNLTSASNDSYRNRGFGMSLASDYVRLAGQ